MRSSFRFIDIPVKKTIVDYEQCIRFLKDLFGKEKGLIALYQFGHVSTPGISDIDLIAVFKNNYKCSLDPFKFLPEEFHYLFSHKVEAFSEAYFKNNHRYTFWHNMDLILGSDLIKKDASITSEDLEQLKIQTALEFLVTNYIDLVLQKTFGIFKLRSFLQHAKGLMYDLELLNIEGGDFYFSVKQIRNWINNWFVEKTDNSKLQNWINSFYLNYTKFLSEAFLNKKLYTPVEGPFHYKRNILLIPSKELYHTHNGVLLPGLLSFTGRKYFNLHHRLNKFVFGFPMSLQSAEGILHDRLKFFEDMKQYNENHFPYFDTLTPEFAIYRTTIIEKN